MDSIRRTTKYVIKYRLNGERHFQFAELQTGSDEEARTALEIFHASADNKITDVKASKPL